MTLSEQNCNNLKMAAIGRNTQTVAYIYAYMTLFEQNCNNLRLAAIGRNM